MQLYIFFIAIANDHEIAQKKQSLGPNHDNIKRLFFVETKQYKSPKDYSLYYNV